MAKRFNHRIKDFCSNSDGNIVIAQAPNLPIIGWISSKLMSMLPINNTLQHGFGVLSMAFLFTWAYLEITNGDSSFRKLLGGLVMTFTIIIMFKV